MSAQEFITTSGSGFRLGDSEFNFLGFNAYYLMTETAFGKKYITDDVFNAANEIGVEVVRTWAFYESDGTDNPAVICPEPGIYNEEALQALDYVVFMAKEKSIKLILTLCNNNPHYGGIPQYLRWGSKYLNKNLRHQDFFTNDSVKTWYKNYMHMLLNRVNTYTGISYKDEKTIFSFELLNEGSNTFGSPEIIYNWYAEMSDYFKTIDINHLLTTGESGEDNDRTPYSDINLFYNSAHFLFNGFKGTSYSKNITLPGIDYGSFHLYTGGWRMHRAAGINWIKEHLFLAETISKPALLGEFGSKDKKPETYARWLEEVSTMNSRSAIIWQYLHPDVINTDGYGFNLSDTAVINVLKHFVNEINSPPENPVIPLNARLYQNYPNPFNPVTTIKYDLNSDDNIVLELFSITGEKIGVLDEGFKKKGSYELTLSFQSFLLASGTYIYTLRTSSGKTSRKFILLK
jgi:mannan endo-1,4-beta-mannosidase